MQYRHKSYTSAERSIIANPYRGAERSMSANPDRGAERSIGTSPYRGAECGIETNHYGGAERGTGQVLIEVKNTVQREIPIETNPYSGQTNKNPYRALWGKYKAIIWDKNPASRRIVTIFFSKNG